MARVLIVDVDDGIKRLRLEEKLRELGHEVVVAGPQPTDAVQLLSDTSPGLDLPFLDVYVRKMRFVCVDCKGKKKHEHFPDGPYGPPHYYPCQTCKGLGFTTKSVNPAEHL